MNAKLLELSRRVDRLRPDRRDPEKFFEERDEIAWELVKLATGYDNEGKGLNGQRSC